MTRIKKSLCLLLALLLAINVTAFSGAIGFGASAADSLTLIPGSTLNVKGGFVYDVVSGSVAGNLAANFVEDAVVYNTSGNVVGDSIVVSNGYTVRNGNATLTIIICGDVSGDGVINVTDLTGVKNSLSSGLALSGASYNAADTNGDGVISTSDLISIQSHVSGNSNLFAKVYGAPFVLAEDMPKYTSASDAEKGTNSIGTAAAGTYYVYKNYPHGLNGMYNLSTDSTGNTAGFWINPTATEVEDPATGTPYVVVTAINKYATSTDAYYKTNATGTIEAGTYYIYNNYPNGYNGMYNLSTDSTGNTAGFWINPSENVINQNTYVLEKDTPKYSSATDAIAKTNSTGTATAGTYYIYNGYPNGYQGMYNLTTDPTGASAGFWINPTEDKPTAATYLLVNDTPKYSSSADAIAMTNSTGTAAAGTYYVYNGYPEGYQGVFNLTTDSTGEVAGFWINPNQITTDFIGANGRVNLVRNINKYSSSTDALHQTNITGTADKDTVYYVYKNYPNGYNGVYNITTDATGATAGIWVNPIENTTGKLNYETMKGIWISQYEIQTMSISSGKQASQAVFTGKVVNALTAAKNSGYNTVIIQVRPNGDSFYPSEYYAPSKYIVGSYGRSFSYDPFAIIIEQAHELALSVQAWVNPLRLMQTDEISSISSTYKIKQWYNSSTYNGKYIVAVNGTYYLNPAYAETRQLVIDGVKEICNNYNVDGIHFDDYFYPEGVTSSFDSEAFAASGQTNIGNFRRACTNALVRGTYSAVKEIDSELLFGISPAGSISGNMYTIYADVNTWVANTGYIDYVAPQIYWGFEHSYTPYMEALNEWTTLVGKKDLVKLIIGLDLSMAYGSTDSYDGTEWTDNKDVIQRQIKAAATKENFAGVIMFSMRYYYNISSGAYVGNLSAERANYEPELKGLYVE